MNESDARVKTHNVMTQAFSGVDNNRCLPLCLQLFLQIRLLSGVSFFRDLRCTPEGGQYGSLHAG